MPKNVWRDDPYTGFTGSTLDFKLYKDGVELQDGVMTAYDFPITIYLNRYAQTYLNSTFPTSTGVTADPDASGVFTIKDDSGTTIVSETYVAGYAGEFNADMSEPIDGKADMRQLFFHTQYSASATGMPVYSGCEDWEGQGGGGQNTGDTPYTGDSQTCNYQWVKVARPAWVATYEGAGPNYYTTVNGVYYHIYGRRRLKQDGPGYPDVYAYLCV